MKAKDIGALVEKIAPLGLAQSWDNVGLLIGDPERPIKNIVLTGPREGRWEYVETGRWWRLAHEHNADRLDAWFQFWAPGEHRIEIILQDGTARAASFTVPDVPVEEAGGLQAVARARGVDVILLAAPTSTDARLARIAAAASGFIYCVSTTGVTGARAALRTDLPEFVARIRRHTDLPLAVGSA